MIAYKVVFKYNNSYFSCLVADENCIVEYKINKWVFPKIHGSRLFVFKKLQYARNFRYSMPQPDQSGLLIFKCEVAKLRKSNIVSAYLSAEDIVLFWRQEDNLWVLGSPMGTYITDKVKLLEEVTKCKKKKKI